MGKSPSERLFYAIPFAMALYVVNFWLIERQDPPEIRLRKNMKQAWMLHPAAREFRDEHLKDIGYDLPDKNEKE